MTCTAKKCHFSIRTNESNYWREWNYFEGARLYLLAATIDDIANCLCSKTRMWLQVRGRICWADKRLGALLSQAWEGEWLLVNCIMIALILQWISLKYTAYKLLGIRCVCCYLCYSRAVCLLCYSYIVLFCVLIIYRFVICVTCAVLCYLCAALSFGSFLYSIFLLVVCLVCIFAMFHSYAVLSFALLICTFFICVTCTHVWSLYAVLLLALLIYISGHDA